MKSLRNYLYIPFLFLLLLSFIPQNTDAQRRRSRRGVTPDSLVLDSLSLRRDSLLLDSLTLDSLVLDTLQTDTAGKKKDALDAPVTFSSSDSTVMTAADGYARMYGNAKINYQAIELTASVVAMNLDSSVVHANGVPDSTGTLQGKPIFKEGETPYESEKMSYNFKSKRGFINNITTEQGEGYITSESAKKGNDDEYYMEHGRYTTCDDHEHPHFYLALSRAKVRPKKNVVFGPAWLVLADVPLPLAIPFGFFPFSSSYSSGFIMPSYGEESTRGFYLRDGGYYFAINDKIDLKLTGAIYTKGSWEANAASTYNKRYKFSGNFSFSYQDIKTGDKGIDYSESRSFRLQWTHRQDSKANPNSNFSASINYSSTSYDKDNLNSLYDATLYSQSTKTSSVSYSRTFSSIGLTISSTFNATQSTRDSTVSLTLPDLNINLTRFYPFKRKNAVGKERWYEKISVQYTGQISNTITTKEDYLLKSNLARDWSNGWKHSIPIQASFTLFNYINVTPSFNYTERWYLYKVKRNWDSATQTVVRDTINGFNRVYNYDFSISANTKLYGFYKPSRKIFGDKIEMIRHVLTPTISYSMAPDFSSSRYGFYDTYTYTDEDGEVHTEKYSYYTGMLYGTVSEGRTGSISLSLSNNLEMKVKSDKDSTGVKKISLIDEFRIGMSYNLAAEEKPWSDMDITLRLKLSKSKTFSLSASFATYAYEFNENGQVVEGNRTEWSYGRFGRFSGMSQNLSYTFDNNTWKKWFSKDKKETQDEDADDGEDNEFTDMDEREERKNGKKKEKVAAEVDEDGYLKFKMPWSLTVSYGITMSENRSASINTKTMRYPYKFTQNLNFSGNIKLSDGWNINFSSGYDFDAKAISTSTVNITRDLHCFSMSCGLVFGSYQSYNFTISANASMLKDALKWDKRSSYSSNVEWY